MVQVNQIFKTMRFFNCTPEFRTNLNWFLIIVFGYSYSLVVNWDDFQGLNLFDKSIMVLMTMASYLVVPFLIGLAFNINKSWLKKSNLILISTIGFLFITNTNEGYVNFFNKQNYYAERMALKFVNNYGETLPRKADSYTRIDAVDFQNNELIFKFTLVEWSIAELDLIKFNSDIRLIAYEEVKQKEELKYFYENGIAIKYKYYDKWGDLIDVVVVAPLVKQ